MTREEAKTKVCPFIQGTPTLDSPQTANINCICDECMAWVNVYDIVLKAKK